VDEGDDVADGSPSGSPASVEMINGGAEHGQRHNALTHKTSGEVQTPLQNRGPCDAVI